MLLYLDVMIGIFSCSYFINDRVNFEDGKVKGCKEFRVFDDIVEFLIN